MLKYMLFVFYCSGLLAMERVDCEVHGARLQFSLSEARSLGIVNGFNATNSIDIKHIPQITKKVDPKLGEFFEAIYRNKPKKIQELAKIVNINGQDPFFKITPLMYASYRGKVSNFKLLLELGADLDMETPAGWTALSIAIDEGQTQILQLILNVSSNRDAAIQKAFALAYEKYDKNILRLLIRLGGLEKYEANTENNPLLDRALHRNDLSFFKELHAAGCDIKKVHKGGGTLLMCACQENFSDFATYIIDQFQDKTELKSYINLCDDDRHNAFTQACGSGSKECLNLLIGNGVDLTDRNINEGLYYAFTQGQSHIVEIVKKYSRPIEDQAIEDIKKITGKIRNKKVDLGLNFLTFLLLKNTNAFGRTIKTNGDSALIELKVDTLTYLLFLLVKLNEDTNVKETKHCSVCPAVGKMQACGNCHWVSYCSRDCQRKHWGVHKPYCQHKQLLDEAIKNYRHLNYIDDKGQTLLHKAVIIGYHNLARVIYKVIDISIRDKNGQTALDLAQEKQDLTMINILTDEDKDQVTFSINGIQY